MFDASIEQRSTLQSMYQDASMLTFENEQFMGMQAIMTKLTVRLPQGLARELGQRCAGRATLTLAMGLSTS